MEAGAGVQSLPNAKHEGYDSEEAWKLPSWDIALVLERHTLNYVNQYKIATEKGHPGVVGRDLGHPASRRMLCSP